MPSIKRTASAAAGPGPVAKAQKKAVPKGPSALVVKGLAASDLPQMARGMLADLAVVSLAIATETRDKYQSKIVEMTEGVLLSIEVSMQTKVEDLEGLISEDAKAKEALDQKSIAKGDEIERKHGEVLTKKQQLAEFARSFKSARAAAEAAQLKTLTIEADASAKAKERDMLCGLRTSLEGPLEEGGVDAVVQKLKALCISDSMMVALPAALAKAASERGSFDAMVLTSVQGELDARIAAADEVIRNVEPSKAVASEALCKAEAALKEANAQQVGGAAAYQKVHAEEEELGREADELKSALRKARETSKKHTGMNSKAKSTLDAFLKGPKQAFEELRDKAEEAAEPVEAEQPAPEAESTELIVEQVAA